MAFSDLGLSGKVLQAVESSGYTEPTPIQAEAIPHVLARRDVLGIAQTGTGKTAAFTLPMLTLLETGRARARMPRTLILEPTRELAAQVEESFIKYGVHHKLNVALLIGGVSFADQDAKITRGVDVLIATPGRLLDHFERGKLLLSGIEVLVIDEADRMLDMGFIPDIERICKMVPFTRQTLFFSATMPPEIQNLVDNFLSNPARVEVARASSTASTITQLAVASGSEAAQKRKTLRRLIRDADELKNGIIFCNRKRDVAVVQRSLEKHGFSVVALHGDMDQRSRMQALDRFRNNDVQLLVASDVAARGLDIPDVSHVFNYDTPHHAEDYVHRIGRTGRAGRKGTAYTIITPDDSKSAAAIVAMTGKDFEWLGLSLDESGIAGEDDGASRDRRHDRRRGKDGRDGKRGRDGRRREGEADEPQAARQHEQREERQQDERPEPRRQDSRPQEPRQDFSRDPRGDARHDARNGGRNGQRDDRRGRNRQERDEPSPPGFGEHTPAFMLVKATPKRRSGKPAEAQVAEPRRESGPVTPVAIMPTTGTQAAANKAHEDARSQDAHSRDAQSPERGERKRRDRRRRGGRKDNATFAAEAAHTAAEADTALAPVDAAVSADVPAIVANVAAAPAETPDAAPVVAEATVETSAETAATEATVEKPKRKRAPRKTAAKAVESAPEATVEAEAPVARPTRSRSRKAVAAAGPAAQAPAETTPVVVEATPAAEAAPAKKRAPRKAAADMADKTAASKAPAARKTTSRKKPVAEATEASPPEPADATEADAAKAPRPARTRTRRSARTTRGADAPAGEEADV